MSNVTPPGPAADERVTVKIKEVAPVFPSFRETLLMEIPPVQGFKELDVFLGLGVPVAKSTELLLLSVQPDAPLNAEVVLVNVAVGPDPSKQLVPVPYPTISWTLTPDGQTVPLVIVRLVFNNTTLPAPAAIGIVPITSGVGRLTVPPAPCAC